MDGGTKFGRHFDKTHASAFTIVLEPLHFADALQAMAAVKRKRERHQAIGSEGADRAETKAILGNAEKHAAVAGTELEVDELIRLLARKGFLAYFHREAFLLILTQKRLPMRGSEVQLFPWIESFADAFFCAYLSRGRGKSEYRNLLVSARICWC
jgi:hypothetical protein